MVFPYQNPAVDTVDLTGGLLPRRGQKNKISEEISIVMLINISRCYTTLLSVIFNDTISPQGFPHEGYPKLCFKIITISQIPV